MPILGEPCGVYVYSFGYYNESRSSAKRVVYTDAAPSSRLECCTTIRHRKIDRETTWMSICRCDLQMPPVEKLSGTLRAHKPTACVDFRTVNKAPRGTPSGNPGRQASRCLLRAVHHRLSVNANSRRIGRDVPIVARSIRLGNPHL